MKHYFEIQPYYATTKISKKIVNIFETNPFMQMKFDANLPLISRAEILS